MYCVHLTYARNTIDGEHLNVLFGCHCEARQNICSYRNFFSLDICCLERVFKKKLLHSIISATADESEHISPESTTPQTVLTRLRNRQRIQIQPKAAASKTPTAAPFAASNRKVNPLISRRKIGTSTTTG